MRHVLTLVGLFALSYLVAVFMSPRGYIAFWNSDWAAILGVALIGYFLGLHEGRANTKALARSDTRNT
jgi:ABC-type cobalt transport system substrate-binding protein